MIFFPKNFLPHTIISLFFVISLYPLAYAQGSNPLLAQQTIKNSPPTTQKIKLSIRITGLSDELKQNALAYLELNKHLNDPHFSEIWLTKRSEGH